MTAIAHPSATPGYQASASEYAAHWVRQLVVIVLISAILLPIAWIFLTAFKTPRDVYSISSALWFTPTFENMQTVFRDPWNLGSKIINSFVVAGGTVLLAIIRLYLG